jgi:antitoxin component YwqK of YwqJK toxin-antitoxin module
MHGDKYEGTATYWFENGNLQTTCTYKNNVIDGVLRSYYPTGVLQAEQHFTNGKLNGSVKAWDDGGKLTSEANYSSGLLHGRYAEYYPNKTLKLEGNYLNGDHDGIWLYYDNSGMIIGEGNFTGGNGIQKAFYENGTAKQVTHYTKNVKDGEEVFYKPDATPDVINQYAHGKLISKIKK